MGRSFWTDEDVALASRLWKQGCSGGQIAKALEGFSRCAVMGKLRRLGLLGVGELGITRPRRVTKLKASKPPKAPKPAPAPRGRQFAEPVHKFEPVTSPEARPWLERTSRQCAFPVEGLGADTLSCCNPTDGRSYCAGHYRMMYRPDENKATRKARADKRLVAYLAEQSKRQAYEDPGLGIAA